MDVIVSQLRSRGATNPYIMMDVIVSQLRSRGVYKSMHRGGYAQLEG